MYVWQTCVKCGRNFQISAARQYSVGANECEECKEKWRSKFKSDAAEAAAGFAMLVAFLYANREGIKKFFVTTGTFLKTWTLRIVNRVRAIALHVYDNRQSIKDRTKEIASTISASVKEAQKKLAKTDDTAAEHSVSATLTSSGPHTLISETADFAGSAKQAKDFTVDHTPKTQVDSTTLSRAYYELGKEILKSRRFQHEFADLFKRIISTNNEINTLKQSPIDQPPATDLKGKLQSGAANLNVQRKASTLKIERDSLVREFGKKAFEKHGDSAGSVENVSAITSALEQVTQLDGQIKASPLSESIPFWQRIPLAVLLSICCFPIGLFLVWKNPRLSRRSKTLWIGGFACLLILGGIMEWNEREKANAELFAAKQLWDSNDKAGAISKYRTVVKSHLHVIPESDRSLIMGRVIDFDAESGNDSSVQELLKKADDERVVPTIISQKARLLQTKRLGEQNKLATTSTNPASGRGVSEDFFPFKVGSQRHHSKTLYLGSMKIQSRREITHEKNGIIRTRTVSSYTVPATNRDLPVGDVSEERYQIRGGFIEIGMKVDNDPWFYEPVVKLGAKVGDTWKSTNTSTYAYKLLSIEENTVQQKSVTCAIIELTISDENGKTLCIVTSTYAQGIGPVETTSRVANDSGKLELSWTENLSESQASQATSQPNVADVGRSPISSEPKAFSGTGPNGEKVLKGDHGDGTGRYWHYYVDKSGKEVLHGPGREGGFGKFGVENIEYEQGVLKSRVTFDTNGRLVESFTRLGDGTYQRDEYKHAGGSTVHMRSTVSITRVDGGSEIKTIIPKVQIGQAPKVQDVQEGDTTPLPSVRGRSLNVTVGTVTTGNMAKYVRQHNASLSSVKCIATEGQLVIDFDLDSSQWSPVARKFPLLVRLFDKNGQYLTHFRTAEGFTVHYELYERYKKGFDTFTKFGDAKGAAERRCELLKPKGNRVMYNVNVRDLRDASAVEIGFAEP